MKALVADDSEIIRKIISSYLAGLGINDVDLAADGAEALVKAKSGGHDLILLDWNMPKMLGIDVLRRLRGAGVRTPVIMVTTEANKGNVLEAIKAGANNYIIKPLQKDTFQASVRQTLERAGIA